MKRTDFLKALGAFFTVVTTQAVGGAPPRKPVIPIEVIKQYRLEPAKEYGFTVKGEDGQDYSIDDCLRALFDISQQHWRGRLAK